MPCGVFEGAQQKLREGSDGPCWPTDYVVGQTCPKSVLQAEWGVEGAAYSLPQLRFLICCSWSRTDYECSVWCAYVYMSSTSPIMYFCVDTKVAVNALKTKMCVIKGMFSAQIIYRLCLKLNEVAHLVQPARTPPSKRHAKTPTGCCTLRRFPNKPTPR